MFQKEGGTNETGYLQGVDRIWWKECIFLCTLDLLVIFYLLIYLCIYLAASGLSCSMWDLHCQIVHCGARAL